MSTIQVLAVTPEVLEKYRATGSVTITTKKEEKVHKGTIFKNFRVVHEGKPYEWFSFEDVPVSRGAADPLDATDVRNNYDGTRKNAETNYSKSPLLVDFFSAVNDNFMAAIKAKCESGEIVLGKRDIHPMVRSRYGDEHKEHPGELLDKNLWSVNMKISFAVWAADAPFKPLRGLPKTQILDYNKKYNDARGVEQYETAQVENAEGKLVPVAEDNFHRFINDGAVLRKIRLHVGSVPISKDHISCPIDLTRAVVETGGPGGFSDELPPAKITETLRTALAPAKVEAPISMQVVESSATPDDVANLLASIHS